MKHKIGERFYNRKSYKFITIDNVREFARGTLYTVQYDSGKYRNYYDREFANYFSPATIENNHRTSITYKNVIFYDFRNRTKFKDHGSWYAWLTKLVS